MKLPSPTGTSSSSWHSIRLRVCLRHGIIIMSPPTRTRSPTRSLSLLTYRHGDGREVSHRDRDTAVRLARRFQVPTETRSARGPGGFRSPPTGTLKVTLFGSKALHFQRTSSLSLSPGPPSPPPPSPSLSLSRHNLNLNHVFKFQRSAAVLCPRPPPAPSPFVSPQAAGYQWLRHPFPCEWYMNTSSST